jgi:hypothetical protein
VGPRSGEISLPPKRVSPSPTNSIVPHQLLKWEDLSPESIFKRPIFIIFQSPAAFAHSLQYSSAYLSTTYNLFFAPFYHFSHLQSFVFNILWTLFRKTGGRVSDTKKYKTNRVKGCQQAPTSEAS